MKEKATNFTEEEIALLVDLYAKNGDILQGKFGSSAGALAKKRIWNDIWEAVNAVGNNNRTLAQVKKKVKNMRNITKAVVVSNKRSFRKTGGGSDDDEDLDPNQEKLLSTISSRQINGIPGGIDVHKQKGMFPVETEKNSSVKIEEINNKSGSDLPSSSTSQLLRDADRLLSSFNDNIINETITSEIDGSDQPRLFLVSNDELQIGDEADIEVTSESNVIVNKISTGTKEAIQSSTPRTVSQAQKNLSKKRKSQFVEGPQVKLMREQVAAVEDQVSTLKNIESVLSDLRDIEKKKLGVMEAHLALKLQKLKQQSAGLEKADIGVD